MVDQAQPAAKRRARWPWVILIVVVIVAALAVVAELVARAVLPGVVRGIVVEQLELPEDQQLEVDAGGVLLPQLIGGRLDALHLSTDSVTFGGITGAVDVTATDIPLGGGDLTDAHGSVRIDQTQFTILSQRTELPIDEIAFEAPDVTASGTFEVLGAAVPLSLTVTPEVDDGDLLLTPVSFEVLGARLQAAELVNQFGAIARPFIETQRICIADQLPAGLAVTGLEIEGSEAVIDVEVDGAIVTHERLQQNGVCG